MLGPIDDERPEYTVREQKLVESGRRSSETSSRNQDERRGWKQGNHDTYERKEQREPTDREE